MAWLKTVGTQQFRTLVLLHELYDCLFNVVRQHQAVELCVRHLFVHQRTLDIGC